jgi:hypothetical protein
MDKQTTDKKRATKIWWNINWVGAIVFIASSGL